MSSPFIEYIKEEVLQGFPSYSWQYFDHLESEKGRSELTIKAYALDIRCFYDFLVSTFPSVEKYQDVTLDFLDRLTMEDVEKYVSFLSSGEIFVDGKKKAIREKAPLKRRRLSALRSYLQYYKSRGDLKMNVAKLVENPTGESAGKAGLDDSQVAGILNCIAEGRLGEGQQKRLLERSQLRDYAIVALFSYTGIRVSELVNLNIGDVDFANRTIRVWRRKQGYEPIYMNNEVAEAIRDYIECERFDKDETEDALFLSSRTKTNSRLSVSAVERLVKKFGSNVAEGSVTPHTLRRTFSSKLQEVQAAGSGAKAQEARRLMNALSYDPDAS